MSLTPRHRKELIVGSGITEAIVAQRGYETAETGERIAELGFSPEQCLAPALIIPIHGVDGGVVGYQAKPDQPRERDGKPIKYETPLGAAMRLDICPVDSIRAKLKNPAEDLWITEGVKKGDSAASRGLCCIALMGVWNWRGRNDLGGITELADWEAVALKGRKVYIAFDSDVMLKPQVQAALRRLAAFLKRRGARDVVPIVPFKAGHDGKLGIDDFFVAGGTVDELKQCADHDMLEERAIKAVGRQLPDITADALDALVDANDPPVLFVREGKLTRVTHDENGVPKINMLNVKTLRGVMARSAKWVKTTEKGHIDIAPPMDVVDDVFALGRWPLPPIISVTLCPVLSPSGKLRREHGYDPESRFYIASPGTWPTWEGTTESARDFLLNDFLGDFAFATDADRANALAMLLLPIVRPAIDGPTPLHLIDAPVQGSGKSLLAEASLMVTCGDTINATPAVSDEDEWRKSILASLLDGHPYIWIDNVTRLVKAEALDIVLTSRSFSGRLLGLSETVTAPVRATWVMTSNNADLSRDLVRRTCWVRIDPKVERPEDRPESEFRHPNIKGWVSANRGQLIAALCKLVESWVDSGMSAYSGQKLGSYESWCKTIGGILENAGVSGFLGNMEALRLSANTTETAWAGFYLRWWQKFGGDAVKAGDLREMFEMEPELAGLLGNGVEASRVTKLGHQLRKRVDRIVGGLKIVRSQFKTDGSTSYMMVQEGEFTLQNANPLANPILDFEPETDTKNEVNGVNGVISTHTYTRAHPPAHPHMGFEKPHQPPEPHSLGSNSGSDASETPLGDDANSPSNPLPKPKRTIRDDCDDEGYV